MKTEHPRQGKVIDRLFTKLTIPALISGLSFLVVAAILSYIKPDVNRDFYPVVATIIPTLIITLAIQTRYFQPDVSELEREIAKLVKIAERRPQRRLVKMIVRLIRVEAFVVKAYAASVLVFIIAGEIGALIGTATPQGQRVSGAALGVTCGGLAAAIQAILWLAILGDDRVSGARGSQKGSTRS
jgi:hypothetical protein